MVGVLLPQGLLGATQQQPVLGAGSPQPMLGGWQPGTIPQWVPDWLRGLSNQVTTGTQQSMQNISNLTQRVPGAGPMTPQDFNVLMSLGMTPNFIAYHGSPHTFDVFDTSKIGTGEGAQAYGHGLYFAERPGVAASYRDALSDATVGGEPYNLNNPGHKAAALVDQLGSRSNAVQQVSAALERDPTDAFNQRVLAYLQSDDRPISPIKSGGSFYKVDIQPERHEFLDWDKPLSEQPQHLATLKDNLAGKYLPAEKMTGQNVVKILGENKLQQAGIPGIRYLDQGSRGTGAGTYNYVVFDPAHIKILERNNQLIGPLLGAQPQLGK